MSSHKHPLGTVAELGDEAIAGLNEDLRGDLILPDHDEYEDARNVWNGLVNEYPAVVVRAAGGRDVATAVGFAREHDLELGIKGGAHHQTGAAVVDNGLVIDLEDLDHVTVDPEEQVADVGPGNRAEDLLAETQAHGLAAPTGSAGDVGIPGTTLGGGIGWIRRKHGLSIDALRSVEIVTPDGELHTASPEHNEDLFWAVRGGGGNFGIVTNFEFELYEVGPIVGGLGVFYPREDAPEVLAAHREYMADAPEELSTILINAHIPALPAMPEELHGTPAIGILGCYAGPPEEGMGAIAPLREIAEPIIDMSEPMPYEVLHDLGTQMYPWGRKYCHRSVFVDELTDEVHEIMLEQTDSAPGPLEGVAIWPMGGAIGHGPDAAYAHEDRGYMITVEGNWEAHDSATHLEWARETERRLREAGGTGAYTGFTGVEEQEWEDWTEQVYADSYDRLAAVKREYDPENALRHNVNVDPRAAPETPADDD